MVEGAWRAAGNLRSPSAKNSFRTCAIAGLAGVLLGATPTAARDNPTVRENLPGCHAAVDDQATVADRIGAAGRCTGIIETLILLGERLPTDLRFCVPRSIRHYEVIRLIADKLEEQYASVENQSFTNSAIAILHTSWPCDARRP
jgi:hypothetical protein